MTTQIHHGLASLGFGSLLLLSACGVDSGDSMGTFGSGLTGVTTAGGDTDDSDGSGDPTAGATTDSMTTSGDPTGDDSAGSTDGPMPDVGDDDDDPTTTSGGAPDPDPGIADCSLFGDAEGLFDFVMSARGDYAGEGIYLAHARYQGIPWQGNGHDTWTFPNKMTWDGGLADQAQAQAEQLAAGSNPQGTKVNGQASVHNPMWIDGINTGDWQITVTEDLTSFSPDANPFSSDVAFALDKSNGAAREGLFYHDFGGSGPTITRLGVGGALGEGPTGECQVWWVLQFGE